MDRADQEATGQRYGTPVALTQHPRGVGRARRRARALIARAPCPLPSPRADAVEICSAASHFNNRTPAQRRSPTRIAQALDNSPEVIGRCRPEVQSSWNVVARQRRDKTLILDIGGLRLETTLRHDRRTRPVPPRGEHLSVPPPVAQNEQFKGRIAITTPAKLTGESDQLRDLADLDLGIRLGSAGRIAGNQGGTLRPGGGQQRRRGLPARAWRR